MTDDRKFRRRFKKSAPVDEVEPIAPLESREDRLARRAAEQAAEAERQKEQARREAEAARQEADRQARAKAKAEAQRRAEQEAKARDAAAAKAEADRVAQARARAVALEKKRRAEAAARAKAEAEARALAEAQAEADRQKAERMENLRRAQTEAQEQAEAAARAAEKARQRAEAALRAEEEARRAEDQRKAEEARRAEDQRKAEEARRAEEQRKAEEARRAEEQRKAEEALRAEEQRKVEEARRAEEQRKADEARRAEDQRKAEEAQHLAAVEKARAAAARARRTAPETPADPWDDLATFKLDEGHLARNRIITAQRDDPAHAAFDVLRTRLLQALNDNGWKRVAITSPGKDCGKTFTAANLAISLSRQENCRTLLMDCDMRRPSLHKIMGVQTPGAMGEMLRGNIDPSQHLLRMGSNRIHAGRNIAFGFNNLAEPYASELLQDPVTARTLDLIEERYSPDVMLFDLPPALFYDDVIAFRPLFDGVLLVIGGGLTTEKEVKEVERRLGEQTPLLGLVLNKAEGTEIERYRY